MSRAILLPCAIVLSLSSAASADTAVAVAGWEVMTMMSRIPGRPGDPRSKPYAWDGKSGAPAVARAIAETAPTREWAARMAVYAVHESGLQLSPCASGDGGRSLGPWQLMGVPEAVACDPEKAARVWLKMAQQSEADCATLPKDERMAELVSGSCAQGHILARRREVMVLGALG